ncbi:hypothetical protein UA08_03503 [Talaromyces atroroseus]|uniref:SRP9 domain-containing protein n=1 Tax=Talaromyces atroroseus TaxID=1441469 RepID=A0A225APH5_TALAT|nr:hypothetical protein UA08_03503 [Talaromyces atroroseus]OKL61393.1 hypothetical protein UA08_03503 [Talaromyces atroroseus]
MPYLPTPNAFLEQSSLLLEAYPDNTRITTKYSYPSSTSSSQSRNKNNKNKISKSKPATTETSESTTATTTTVATLTLKTYNPVTGICLKYKTNKAAEVGRLISGLGKLAAGLKIGADEAVAAAPPVTAGAGQDVEMIDAPQQPAVQSQSQTAGGGGGGKKKKGKGKK